jgi:DNA-binding NarL/FixJ family response regulator
VTAADEEKGIVWPGDAPMGLVWLKGCQQEVASLGLEDALRAVRIHRGQEQPTEEPPAAVVIWCLNGEDLASKVRSVRALVPGSAVLIFASAPNLQLARGALEAGASGLVHSRMSSEQILRAISVVIRGELVLPRELIRQWIEAERRPDLKGVLPARQREILELVAEGLSNAAIAGRLFLSQSTVKQHLRKAYKTLGVRNRREAAGLLRRSGRYL